ncbi:MAG TPA: hypothetical protein VF974_06475 [Patescibacteria group bacterium]
MRERGYSPENPFPPEKLSPISPEDQRRAEESLEETRIEKRQNLLNQKKMERPKDIYGDKADRNQKTLKTRHAGPVAKGKRGLEKLSQRFNKPAVKLKYTGNWEDKKETS